MSISMNVVLIWSDVIKSVVLYVKSNCQTIRKHSHAISIHKFVFQLLNLESLSENV